MGNTDQSDPRPTRNLYQLTHYQLTPYVRQIETLFRLGPYVDTELNLNYVPWPSCRL